jgi:hypothetical protein
MCLGLVHEGRLEWYKDAISCLVTFWSSDRVILAWLAISDLWNTHNAAQMYAIMLADLRELISPKDIQIRRTRVWIPYVAGTQYTDLKWSDPWGQVFLQWWLWRDVWAMWLVWSHDHIRFAWQTHFPDTTADDTSLLNQAYVQFQSGTRGSTAETLRIASAC